MNTTEQEHHELPSGWKWLKLGRIGEITLGQSPPSSSYRDTPEGLPFFQGKADFGATSPNPTSWCVSPRKIAEKGDILISVRAPVGPTNLADRQCCIGRGLASIRTGDGADTNFVLYALKNFETDLLKQGTGSTFDAITGSQLKNLYIAVPPLPEQVAIARYLDYVDVRVRRLTEAKRKLIGLLTEYKQAIIHRAVTRGLDPNVSLKDSSIEWLGMIPEHWDIKRLKQAFHRIVGGSTPSSSNSRYWNGEYVWVTPSDVSKNSQIYDSQRRITQEGLDSCSTEILPAGSIIVTSRAPVGNIALAKVSFCTNQGCKALVLKGDELNSSYAFNLLGILKSELESLANGSTFTEISSNKLGAIRLPIPPISEQVAIVEYLDRANAEIDIAVARAERQIELLNEYRTRLIADVVTGKLDVRDATLTTEDTDTSTALASTSSAHRSDLNGGA